MAKIDGVYRLQRSSNAHAFIIEMGLPEADANLLSDPKNVRTLNLMHNKEGNISTSQEYSGAPHMNSSFTTKIGEVNKMEKPFPCTFTMVKKSETEYSQRMELNGKVLTSTMCFNPYGLKVSSCVEGSSVKNEDTYDKISPCIDGYYEMETSKNLFPVVNAAFPSMTEEMFKAMEAGGIGLRMKLTAGCLTMDEIFGDKRKTTLYKLDQAIDYTDEAMGIDETRMMTQVGPGLFKAVFKDKKTGRISEMTANFTEFGFDETFRCGGLEGSAVYRRRPDAEGCWQVVSQEGGEAYMEAVGIPQAVRSGILAERSTMEVTNLGAGKFTIKHNSKFFPSEKTIKLGEQWSHEGPHGVGSFTGISTQTCDSVFICMNMGGKTITMKEKFSGDFIVRESEVDGNIATRMITILVRQ